MAAPRSAREPAALPPALRPARAATGAAPFTVCLAIDCATGDEPLLAAAIDCATGDEPLLAAALAAAV